MVFEMAMCMKVKCVQAVSPKRAEFLKKMPDQRLHGCVIASCAPSCVVEHGATTAV